MLKHANAEADYQHQANLRRLNIQKRKLEELENVIVSAGAGNVPKLLIVVALRALPSLLLWCGTYSHEFANTGLCP